MGKKISYGINISYYIDTDKYCETVTVDYASAAGTSAIPVTGEQYFSVAM